MNDAQQYVNNIIKKMSYEGEHLTTRSALEWLDKHFGPDYTNIYCRDNTVTSSLTTAWTPLALNTQVGEAKNFDFSGGVITYTGIKEVKYLCAFTAAVDTLAPEPFELGISINGLVTQNFVIPTQLEGSETNTLVTWTGITTINNGDVIDLVGRSLSGTINIIATDFDATIAGLI